MDTLPGSAKIQPDESRADYAAGPDSGTANLAPEETALLPPKKNFSDLEEKHEIETFSHLENSRLIAEYSRAVEEGADPELIQKIKWRIVLANIPLIYSISWPIFKKFKCAEKGFEIDDLISLGYEGMLRAIITFDPSKGFTLGTYAGWWIRNYIVRYINDNDRTMRLPQYIHEKIPKIRMAEDYFVTQGKVHPTDREIADRLGWEEKDVGLVRKALHTSVASLDNTFRGKSDDLNLYNYYPDKIADPENTLLAESRYQIIRSLLELSPRVKGNLKEGERCILKLRFGIKSASEKLLVKVQDNEAGKVFKELPISYNGREKTLEEIGDILGVTRERIRQIEVKALQKLQKLYYHQIIQDSDPSQISVEELSLIKSMHGRKEDLSFERKNSKTASPSMKRENLKALKKFMIDKDKPVG